MNNVLLEFGEGDPLLGSVILVETHKIVILAETAEVLLSLPVGSLIAVQGTTANQYYIAVVTAIIRSLAQAANIDEEEDGIALVPSDIVKATIMATYHRRLGLGHGVLRRGALSSPQINRKAWVLAPHQLQIVLNSMVSEIPADKQLRMGTFSYEDDAQAVADGNKFFQKHAAIVGSTGSGKSWSAAMILERAAELQFPNLIVLDIHGEYKKYGSSSHRFVGKFSCLKLAGPSERTNDPGVLFLPLWLMNREELHAFLIDRSEFNAPNQSARLSSHILALKRATLEAQGQTELSKRITVDSPVPFSADDLIAKLQHDDTEMVPGARDLKQGDYNGKLTRLIGRINSKREDPRYGFMFDPPKATSDLDWLVTFSKILLCSGDGAAGIKIIDFSDVPSDVLPLALAVLVRTLYSIQLWRDVAARTAVTVVCDEAHLYLPRREDSDAVEARCLEVFERIAKEGRKYGVSLLSISQRPSDLSRTILSQCSNFLVLRLSNDLDKSAVIQQLPETMATILDVLSLLEVGEGIVVGDCMLLPSRIRLAIPEVEPESSTRAFWTEWQTLKSEQLDIAQAVRNARQQSRS